jgi:Do/DeqQ family serine protease
MLGRVVFGLVLALGLVSVAGAQERQVPASVVEMQLSFAPIVKRVAPAVVNVYASRTVQRQVSPFFSDPFFRQFFGDAFGGSPSQRVERSLGSGVIVSPDGLIVTNYHVIELADEVRVALADRREFSAEIVLKDERSDLAVLRVAGDVSDLPTIEYADSDSVEVGDLVLAIGDPFGVGQTVTSGIVSAFARVPGGPTDDQYFIQTDAAINPGNSGGALVDVSGRLIGINRMIVSPSGGSSGIGFAIPSNLVRIVASAAEGGGVARRPWLGAELQAITPDLATALGLEAPVGVLVAEVDQPGPAYDAGLKSGDIIVRMDGEDIDDLGALNYRLATEGIGGTTEFWIVRDGERYKATVSLTAAPESVPRDERLIVGDSPFAGLSVLNLSPAVAEEFAYRGGLGGVIVGGVLPGSNADRAGFSRGDVIAEVNRTRIDSTEGLATVAAEPARRWDMVIGRGGRAMQFSFRG